MRTIVAITFCDHLAPEVSRLESDQKRKEISQTWSCWENTIQEVLNKLKVQSDVTNNIKICPTTHTDYAIDLGYFSLSFQGDWLENVWHTCSKMLKTTQRFIDLFSVWQLLQQHVKKI